MVFASDTEDSVFEICYTNWCVSAFVGKRFGRLKSRHVERRVSFQCNKMELLKKRKKK